MKKKVGIIGITGRMGQILVDTINQTEKFHVECGYSRSRGANIEKGYQQFTKFADVFSQSDYVVDFSNHTNIEKILTEAQVSPTPLIICTTGWKPDDRILALMSEVTKSIPVVVAPNTSLGATLQNYLTRQLSKILTAEYDIDIHEKHHRAKIDVPSGTAEKLVQAIIETKKSEYQIDYSSGPAKSGERPEHFVGLTSQRSGMLPGDHEVSFTGEYESISIKHVAFSRGLFAKGVVRILDWLEVKNPKSGRYSMEDVLELN
ncbi:MAG: 4-hydroxy-tetrahydrodipicolinate reductase [Bdellovibrionales bacterium]|nr:4-hydroxy-tetrahydrodipicolinate reductase [Bdellovibrionales bacterium]